MPRSLDDRSRRGYWMAAFVALVLFVVALAIVWARMTGVTASSADAAAAVASTSYAW